MGLWAESVRDCMFVIAHFALDFIFVADVRGCFMRHCDMSNAALEPFLRSFQAAAGRVAELETELAELAKKHEVAGRGRGGMGGMSAAVKHHKQEVRQESRKGSGQYSRGWDGRDIQIISHG